MVNQLIMLVPSGAHLVDIIGCERATSAKRFTIGENGVHLNAFIFAPFIGCVDGGLIHDALILEESIFIFKKQCVSTFDFHSLILGLLAD